MSTRTRARRRALLPAVLLVPLLLTACGGGDGGNAPSKPAGAAADAPAAGHNDQDVMFLQMMIAHHKQGVEMAQVASKRAQGAKVRNLAAAVAATQTEEVKTMSSWLRKWSEPVESDHPAGAHAAHGGMPATGAKEIKTLRKTTGAGFEPAFLNLFVGHQHGAVEMAETELSKGGDAGAKAFAKRVKESRTDQIRQMLGLLDS